MIKKKRGGATQAVSLQAQLCSLRITCILLATSANLVCSLMRAGPRASVWLLKIDLFLFASFPIERNTGFCWQARRGLIYFSLVQNESSDETSFQREKLESSSFLLKVKTKHFVVCLASRWFLSLAAAPVTARREFTNNFNPTRGATKVVIYIKQKGLPGAGIRCGDDKRAFLHSWYLSGFATGLDNRDTHPTPAPKGAEKGSRSPAKRFLSCLGPARAALSCHFLPLRGALGLLQQPIRQGVNTTRQERLCKEQIRGTSESPALGGRGGLAGAQHCLEEKHRG